MDRQWVPSPVLTDNGNTVQCVDEQCTWEPRGTSDCGGLLWDYFQCSVCGWWRTVHDGRGLGWAIDRGDEED